MMVAGCLVMLLAANLAIYEVVLLGLFVLASGITVLQVAANPLAAALGLPERSHFRLTFSQAFNSLGTFIGPYLGAVLFLKGIETKQCEATTQAARLTSLAGIDRAYALITALDTDADNVFVTLSARERRPDGDRPDRQLIPRQQVARIAQ